MDNNQYYQPQTNQQPISEAQVTQQPYVQQPVNPQIQQQAYVNQPSVNNMPPIPQQMVNPMIPNNNGLANQIVCAALSLFSGSLISLVLSIVAIVFSVTNDEKSVSKESTRHKCAVASWAVYGVTMFLAIVITILVFAFAAAASATALC